MILALDTATRYCSVALEVGSKLYQSSDSSQNGHAQKLMPMIDQLLEQADASIQDVTTIVVSLGPGSFTGLRIGIATALGLSSALDIPCYGVSSLRARSYLDAETVCPIMDARRDRIYGACYGALTLDESNLAFEDFLEEIKGFEVVFTGEDIGGFAERAGVPILPDINYAAGAIRAFREGHYRTDITPRYLRVSQAEAEARGVPLP